MIIRRMWSGGLLLLAACFTTVGFLALRARASGIPTTNAFSYSATLTDQDGVLLTGIKSIVFQLWDQEVDGTLQCFVGPLQQPLVAGSFTLPLPQDCAAAVHVTPDLWVEVFAEGVSFGRMKLGAVPYTLEADQASHATGQLSQQIVPAGAVMAFDLSACPRGWTELTAARGRTIIGTNPDATNGLSVRTLQSQVGEESHTLTIAEMPTHAHTQGNQKAFTTSTIGANGGSSYRVGNFGVDTDALPQPVTESTGGGQPHAVMQPSLALLYCRKN